MSLDWAVVYRAVYADLVRYLHRKVWDGERAQELAQEAFVRGLSHEGDGPDNPRAWLFRVASNLARDEARTAVRRRRHLTLVRAESVRAAEPDGPARLESEQRSARVRAALDRLSDRDREALLLWDAGMSYADIAERTGLAAGAVGTTLARARRRLAEAYQALEDEHVARG